MAFVPWIGVNRQRGCHWYEARGLLQRPTGDLLIVRLSPDPGEHWEFPGGRITERAAPEEALRRWCAEQVGVALPMAIPQPRFDYRFGGRMITYHYFLCPMARDEVAPYGCAALRWVAPARLNGYTFDLATEDFIDRVLVAPGGR